MWKYIGYLIVDFVLKIKKLQNWIVCMYKYQICAHLHLKRANKACFFISVTKIWSALLNFFLMGISSSLNPVSSLTFILSKRVIFFLNTCPPPQYFTALSWNSCLIYRSIGLTSASGHSKSYPICLSHFDTVLYNEFFSLYLGGVRQL